MAQNYEFPERLPQPEDIPLDRDQQRAVAELARLDLDADVDSVVELVDTLVTKDRYQAAFDLILSSLDDRHRSDFAALARLSQAAASLVGSSCYNAGEQIPRFNKLASDKLAGWAVLSHQQFLNLPHDSFDQLARRLLREIMTQRSGYSAIYHHAGHLLAMVQFKDHQHILNKLPGRQREARLGGWLASENDELFHCSRRLQKYGVKPAYAADGSQLPIVDWHIHDVAQAAEQAGFDIDQAADAYLSQSRARFTGFVCPLANKPSILDLLDDQDKTQVWAMKYEGVVAGQTRPVQASLVFDIWNDGQLHLVGGSSLAWFADELGLKLQYELVRARALSLFTDLVVPAYMIDSSSQIKAAEKQAAQASRAKAYDFGQLVLARRRIVADPEIDQSIATAEKQERKRTRVVSPHGVVGFIRRLPAGHRASQAQRDLCLRDQGLKLAPAGETYVRGHNRGGNKSDGPAETASHRARLRHVGGSIIAAKEKTDKPESKPIRLELPGLATTESRGLTG